jgi:hypothetical protein
VYRRSRIVRTLEIREGMHSDLCATITALGGKTLSGSPSGMLSNLTGASNRGEKLQVTWEGSLNNCLESSDTNWSTIDTTFGLGRTGNKTPPARTFSKSPPDSKVDWAVIGPS